jgi:hypothetical protein
MDNETFFAPQIGTPRRMDKKQQDYRRRRGDFELEIETDFY